MFTLGLLSVSCARAPSNTVPTYAPVYKKSSESWYSSIPQRQSTPSVNGTRSATNRVRLDFAQLLSFPYDCSHRNDQFELLEDQIRQRTFYKVDGVDGSEYPDRISKRYFALVKYRIWSLRLGCQGSSVGAGAQAKLKDAVPSRPPESVPRCYFEESTVAKTSQDPATNPGESMISRRKEVCTNYPLIASTKEIHRGDIVDPERQLDKNISYIPNLRKWNGGIFQMASKTEIHRDAVVKFTVVLMWNGSGWVVVDKF